MRDLLAARIERRIAEARAEAGRMREELGMDEMTRAQVLRVIGLKSTDRFTPTRMFSGSNDGTVRTQDGRVIADCGGHEALCEWVAVVLNMHMEQCAREEAAE